MAPTLAPLRPHSPNPLPQPLPPRSPPLPFRPPAPLPPFPALPPPCPLRMTPPLAPRRTAAANVPPPPSPPTNPGYRLALPHPKDTVSLCVLIFPDNPDPRTYIGKTKTPCPSGSPATCPTQSLNVSRQLNPLQAILACNGGIRRAWRTPIEVIPPPKPARASTPAKLTGLPSSTPTAARTSTPNASPSTTPRSRPYLSLLWAPLAGTPPATCTAACAASSTPSPKAASTLPNTIGTLLIYSAATLRRLHRHLLGLPLHAL